MLRCLKYDNLGTVVRLFLKSGRPQDLGILNCHSPTRDLIARTLALLNPAVPLYSSPFPNQTISKLFLFLKSVCFFLKQF